MHGIAFCDGGRKVEGGTQLEVEWKVVGDAVIGIGGTRLLTQRISVGSSRYCVSVFM